MPPVSPSSPAIPKGRFAPSPTGPLHFGSIVAALGSCLEARRQGGEWLVRMEDVDEPRCQAGAATQILQTLEALGFAWDGPVMYQSQRKERYREVLEQLKAQGFAYPCACSRKDLANAPPAVDGSPRYPGTCRNGLPSGAAPRAWRLRVTDEPVRFEDALQGVFTQQLERDVGDFVLLRADGYFAYQLAVVVDDADQGITHVVRGADLLDSTPRQIYLQRLLGVPVPAYTHLPVAVNGAGEKLSKQTRAEAVDVTRPVASLLAAWRFLGQDDAPEIESVEGFWQWATTHWNPLRIPRRGRAVAAKEGAERLEK